jgi:hypothetical protein
MSSDIALPAQYGFAQPENTRNVGIFRDKLTNGTRVERIGDESDFLIRLAFVHGYI